MSKKLIFILLFLALLVSPVFTVLAQNSPYNLPEREGTYDVPGRPDLKLRVFIHGPKAKPTFNSVLTCTDLDSSAVDGATGWHLPGSWSYYLNLGSAPSSVAANFQTLAGNAYSTWSSAVFGKVTFSYAGITDASRAKLDGQNIVAWGRTPGTALAVTYTWYYPSTGLVAEVDTIFNKKFPWSWTPYASGACGVANTYDAQDILTHELGHWMGLDDEYTQNYVNNTMYGYGATGEIKKDTLTTGDITGVSAIYP